MKNQNPKGNSMSNNDSEYLILNQYIEERVKTSVDNKVKEIINTSFKDTFNIFKWFVGSFATVFTIFLAASYINFGLEKQQLETFKENTRKELLGELNEEADIVINDRDGNPLKGKTIEVNTIEKIVRINKDNYYRIPKYKFRYSVTFKNTGKGLAENPLAKVYYTKKLEDNILNQNNIKYATDEAEYDYEDTLSLKNTPLSALPPNVSYSNTFSFSKFGDIKPDTYKTKIKIFYGKNQVSESDFLIKVVDKPEIIEPIKEQNSDSTKKNIESIEATEE